MKALLAVLDKLRFYSTLEILRPLPLPWAIRGASMSGRVMYGLCWRRRRQAIQWLRETVPAGTPSTQIVRMSRELFVYASLRRYLSHILLLHDANDWRDLLDVRGWERVEQALGRNKGVVLLTCHLGLPRAERWFLKTKPHHVYYLFRIGQASERDRSWGARFERWHKNRYRQDLDTLLGNEELSVQYMKKAYDHLRRNGIVNMAGDGRYGERRYPVSIGGRHHTLAAGGISLGLMTGAAILPCFTAVGGSPLFHIEIQEPLALPDLNDARAADRNAETKALVEAYAARIDAFISRHPTNGAHPRYSLQIPT
ncbi:MAG: hypothetical protein HYX25_08910 [Candidatus Solibacter usitatus]|nr:hypothetical protein [Candidatus Solibacter usitatus]